MAGPNENQDESTFEASLAVVAAIGGGIVDVGTWGFGYLGHGFFEPMKKPQDFGYEISHFFRTPLAMGFLILGSALVTVLAVPVFIMSSLVALLALPTLVGDSPIILPIAAQFAFLAAVATFCAVIIATLAAVAMFVSPLLNLVHTTTRIGATILDQFDLIPDEYQPKPELETETNSFKY